MTRRENFLRTVRRERPDYIPMRVGISPACWHHYDQNALQDLMESHRFLFPDFQRQERVSPTYLPDARKDCPYTDPWGCVRETTDNGINGSVHRHPLEDWNQFGTFTPPDPAATNGMYPVNWSEIRTGVEKQKENGELVTGSLPHGHTFLRLVDLRGYENLMFDMADDDPNLKKLIEVIETFNYEYVCRWMELNPDVMFYPEDLGMQTGPMLSPFHFRRYIKPSYQRLMKPAREKNVIVHMHSDGDIRLLAEELVDGGVEIINLQDLVNGIDWIAETFKGKICIDLDIDRQRITPHGTPEDIDTLIRREVESLGSKEGGLMMIYGLYPGVPLKNAWAVMDAMEKYATYYS